MVDVYGCSAVSGDRRCYFRSNGRAVFAMLVMVSSFLFALEPSPYYLDTPKYNIDQTTGTI
jgi:hypothetical protein